MLEKYFKKAFKEKWAIGQFNFSTIDQLKNILQASINCKSPLILGTSKGEADFFGIQEAGLLKNFYRKKKKIDVFLNLDHGKDLETIIKAVDAGYDMVHFDGSDLSLEANIKETLKVLKYAKSKKVLVEAELGKILGNSLINQGTTNEQQEAVSIQEIDYFMKKTKVDLLALAVGNVHGIYSEMPNIDFELLKKVQEKNIPIVFHGGSGVSDQDIKRLINCGVVKININTELRIIWRDIIKQGISRNEIAPYKILDDIQETTTLKVQSKIELFNSSDKSRDRINNIL